MIPSTFNTYVGIVFDLDRPDADMIVWPDIVQGLSQIARFSGQSPVFLSVAQHSVQVAQSLREKRCPPEVQWEGLMHDAEEAYPPGDIARPCKYLSEMKPAVAIQQRIRLLVARKFGLPTTKSTAVDEEDKHQCSVEQNAFRDIAHGCLAREWAWSPEHARFMFQAWAIMILSERPHSQDLLDMICSTATDGVVRMALSMGLCCQPDPLKSWESNMADDLRAVFARYGFDPNGPAFPGLIASLEQIHAEGSKRDGSHD